MRALIRFGFALCAGLAAAVGGLAAQDFTYKGLCEASAAATLDDSHFAVASDETNVVIVYKKGVTDPVGTVDFEPFTKFDKSDLEAAARVGSRVYWISSHSLNKEGKNRPKRQLFFASDIQTGAGAPTLKPAGKPYFDLRDPLAVAAGVSHSELNIEGLAATAEGGLLIALRSPLRNEEAIVVPFENPAEVTDAAKAPRFGAAIPLKLNGLGIRSIDRVGSDNSQYLIVAGPISDDATPFRLHRWSGRAEDRTPAEIKDASLDGLKPEALIAFPGAGPVQVLSDDGDICSDEKAPDKRRFRAREIAIR